MKTFRITDLDKPVPSPVMAAAIEQLNSVEIKLDADTLLDLARDKLDVPVDIDEKLIERFQIVFDEIQANGPIHSLGRFGLQQFAVTGIADTSRMNNLCATYPEIEQTQIKTPLIVAGMPRTGSTYLLQLISNDPSFLSVKKWEARFPFPNQAMLKGTVEDTRERDAKTREAMGDALMPHIRSLYDVGNEDSTEEVELMVKGGYGVIPCFLGDTPLYDEAFYSTKQTDAYAYLCKFLKALQWSKQAGPDQRWLLKSPQHLGALDALDEVLPDASLVFMHRDPASIFTSLVTLTGYIARQSYTEISKAQIIRKTMRMQHGFLRGLMKHVDLFEGRSTHVYFHELMADYHESVERVFSIAGMSYDEKSKARVAEQARVFTRGRREGKIVYDLEGDFGLTRDQVREEFSYYLDRFPVAIEDTQQ